MQAKVALARCADYQQVTTALANVLTPLGGMAAFVRPGQKVLLKPNLLSDAPPERATTTHPEIVRAVIRAVRACGAEPCVADAAANVMVLEQVWHRTGMVAVCREEGVPLLNLEQAGAKTFQADGFTFSVARPVLEADVVINLPKVKTHLLVVFTCAVKNLYGALPGLQKTHLHKLYPRPREFARLLLAVYARVRPALSIADGVIGMEGDGPSGGEPVRLGLLAAAADGVALDATLCRLLGVKVASVPHLVWAQRLGVGAVEPVQIEVLGEAVGGLPPLRLPTRVPLDLIPRWVFLPFRPLVWHHPFFTERCQLCGKCVAACPVGALSRQPDARPVLAPRRCIECCCCHEVCPARAIEMRPSPLLRAVHRWRRRS